MAKIKLKGGIALTDNTELKAPKFNFSNYDGSGRTVYHNNAEYIDFVTDNGSLYVCLVDSVAPTGNISSNSAFLKIVDRGPEGPKGKPGEDGASAIEPRIGANFVNDQLKVTVNDKTVAVSPSLTGPTWKPVRDGNILTWELTDDRISPEDIDLMKLRPVYKHPILLRTNSDNTKRSDEVSGPANFIQWKYEGDEYWTNLISISELMNLALCGICFWYDDNDGEWHFGNKEVLKATYESDKNGRKIVSRVELGDVLFDAGSIPINDFGADIDLIYAKLAELENAMPDLSDYATKDWVNAQGFLTELPDIPEQVDAYTKAQSDAKYQPKGNYLTEHQSLKTINGQSLVGSGNITIEGGSGADTSDCVKSLTIDGQTKTPDGNGNITFSLGNFNLFNLEARTINGERHLIKIVNGVETDLGVYGTGNGSGSGEGCDKCWSAEEILEMITDEIAKIEEFDASEIEARIQNLENQINALISDNPEIVAISFVSTTIYTRTNDLTAPTVQTSFVGDSIALDASGDVSEQALSAKLQNAHSIWTTSPGNGNNYLWMSYARVKIPDGVFTSDWSTPMRLTGVPGHDGADGGDIEFVYYRTTGEQPGVSNTGRYYNESTETYSADTTDASNDDFFPKVVLVDQTVNDYWQDHPEGITAQYTHEYVAIRTKKRNGSWGNFVVALWARWGEDGIDGDGVQYIFTRTNDFPHTFTGTNNPVSWDTTTQAYQSKYDEYYEGNWVDDPLGVSADHPFEWVSVRKWRRVNGVYGWQAYSTPALWSTYAENSGTRTIVTLDINNSEQPVPVDTNNKIVKGTDPVFLDTELFSDLRTDSGELLDWGKVYIGKVVQNGITFDENPAITFNASRVPTISNTVSYDNNIQRVVTYAYGSENRYYEFVLSVAFPANHTLSEPYIVPIKVVDSSDAFIGIDYLKFNPVYAEKVVTLNSFNQTDVIKKDSKEATTYNPSSIYITGMIYGDSTFDTVSKFTYSYQFDTDAAITFDQPVINKQTVLQNKSAYYYFDANGNELGSSTGAFATLHIWNTDDNQREWDEWLATMEVTLNGNLIEDKVVLGVGYNRVLTDWETSYVIYPGKDGTNGTDGENGSYKKELYCLGTENSYDGTWNNSWASTGATIATLTGAANAWSATKPTVTSSKPHIWMTRADVTVGEEATQVCEWETPMRITPIDGTTTTVIQHQYQYLDGQVMRVSNWTDAQTKYWDGSTRVGDDNNATGDNTGTYYLDVVEYTSGNDKRYYKCISSTTVSNKSTSGTLPINDTTHWELFTAASDAAMANLLVSNSAFINSLTSHQIVVTDSDNSVVGGMTSSSGQNATVEGRTIGDVRIWAGETTNNGNLYDAPFNVTNEGVVTSQGSIDTDGNNTDDIGLRTVMDNGLINIDVKDLTVQNSTWKTRAKFGYLNGNIVLEFLDDNGNPIYDLGPAGITQFTTNVVPATWEAQKFYYFATLQENDAFSLLSGTPIYLYKYSDGKMFTSIGQNSGVEYYDPANGQYQSAHSTYHGKYYEAPYTFPAVGYYVADVVGALAWIYSGTNNSQAEAPVIRIHDVGGVPTYEFGTLELTNVDSNSGTTGTIDRIAGVNYGN